MSYFETRLAEIKAQKEAERKAQERPPVTEREKEMMREEYRNGTPPGLIAHKYQRPFTEVWAWLRAPPRPETLPFHPRDSGQSRRGE